MSTKIQINSLEALERLIGNDNELEIEIRNSVVENFTKRYLKDLAKTELVANIAKAVQSEIKSEFFEEIKTGTWNNTTTVFKKELLEKVKEELKYTAKQELSSVVSEIVEEQKVYDTIKNKLDSTVEWITEQLAPQRLENRIEKLVEARLKDKLGLK
jgi:uncharacterized membrane-anchored protein YjiN (DUF445 family)